MLNKNSLAVKKVQGQSEAIMTKPIIVVKMPSKLRIVCHSSKRILLIKCSTSWPYLISEFWVTYNHCGF